MNKLFDSIVVPEQIILFVDIMDELRAINRIDLCDELDEHYKTERKTRWSALLTNGMKATAFEL